MRNRLLLLIAIFSFSLSTQAADFSSVRDVLNSSFNLIKRVTYAVFVGTSPTAPGTYKMSPTGQTEATIPQGALITDVYCRVKENVVDGAPANNISIGCASATDLLGAVDASAWTAGQIKAGAPVGNPATTGVILAAPCTPTLTIAAGGSGIQQLNLQCAIEYVPLD